MVALVTIQPKGSAPPSAVQAALTQEAALRHQRRMTELMTHVERLAAGRIVGDVRVGFDHTKDGGDAWWAEIRLRGNTREERDFLVEDEADPPAALEALLRKIDPVVRGLNRRLR